MYCFIDPFGNHFSDRRVMDREILRLLSLKEVQRSLINVNAKVNISESCFELEGDTESVYEAIEELDAMIKYFVIRRISVSRIVYASLSELSVDYIQTKLQNRSVVAGVDLRGWEVHTCCTNSNDSTLTEEIIQSLIYERNYPLADVELRAIRDKPEEWEVVRNDMIRSHTSTQVVLDDHKMMILIAAASESDVLIQGLLGKLQNYFKIYRPGVLAYRIDSKPFLNLISLHSERIRKDFPDPSVVMAIDINKMECTLYANTMQHAQEAKDKLEKLRQNTLTELIQESNKSLLHWFDSKEGEDRLTLWRINTGTLLRCNPGDRPTDSRIKLCSIDFRNLGNLNQVG